MFSDTDRLRALAPLLLAVVLCVSGIGCNPYLPDIGQPLQVTSSRTTPRGVIDQLWLSYTTRRIDLFEEVLLESDFRFYVSPSFVDSGRVPITQEEIDSSFELVSPGVYYWWGYDEEYRSHERLFQEALAIEIAAEPQISENEFEYHLSAGGDTIGVEVEMGNGELVFRIPAPVAGYRYDIPVVVERQVFYMRKDGEGLWAIAKWFDFGTEG